MEKPNILFVFTDQQRFDSMGCYGQPLEVTPNLDRLAKNGVLFKNAFSCQPVCGPARSCLQTGLYATQTGCYRNGVALPTDMRTIAHILSDNGYSVGYIGKWHLASNGLPTYEDIGPQVDYRTKPIPKERRGGYNDYWLASDLLEFTSHPYKGHLFNEDMKKVVFNKYRVDALTDFTLEYLENANKDQPFFLFLSYLEPHQQNDYKKFIGPKYSEDKFSDYEIPDDLKGKKGDWEKNYPDYLGCCHSIDTNFGRINEKLKELCLLNNTIILYTSDHGCHFKTRNREYKRSCHESSIHIPLIIKGGSFKGAKKVDKLVSLIDLPPTILSCAKIQPPNYMEGRDLEVLTQKKHNDWDDEIFIQISESQIGRAIRTEKWKYSICDPERNGFLYSKSKVYQEDYLYDLQNDPFEQRNLIENPEYNDIKMTLKEKLLGFINKIEKQNPTIIPYRV
ncbi:MAG: sulfatase-like hydrolase/transferase [Candidatus Lokiarchaeota archaeon]|nr:sulfatase-like hydrolase/transferase [Candidatus Lokiarchaeota archaeon]MBD3201641.1 sulfatase-like hydrolase/transferase [Candidatus Lokiarchaeota archaeon]